MLQEYLRYKERFADDFSIEHKVSTVNEKISFHIHDVFELFLLLSDGMRCTVGNRTYTLAKNTLLLFNNMDLHHISMESSATLNDRYVLYFLPEFVQPLSSESSNLLECFFYRPFDAPHILPLTESDTLSLMDDLARLNFHAHHLQEGDPFGRGLLLKFLLGELLIKINLLYRKHHHIGTQVNTGNYSRVYDILQYLHQHYTEELTLDFLAARFYINKFHLCNLFKRVTGLSPMGYLTGCRLMKAKELLINGHSVEQVCGQVGYNSLSHFSRSFKQHTGLSPKKYQLNYSTHSHEQEAF